MTAESGPGGRIVINPDDLRHVAVRMRGAALLLSGAGRDLAARQLPAMPPALLGLVTDVMRDANATLQDLSLELVADAQLLAARATWAELGGRDAVAWLIPGLRRHPSVPLPETPSAPVAPVPDEEVRAGSEWAIEILDAIHDSVQRIDGEIARFGEDAEVVFGRDLVRLVNEHADEMPLKALGKFTLAAGAAVDVAEHWDEGWRQPAVRAGMSAAGGALGTGLCMLLAAPTGPGVVGCLFVGGGFGSAEADHLGDQVFEE